MISDEEGIRHCRENPLDFAAALWPEVDFYEKQRDIILSVRDNDETVVPAGNMLGKDFVAGFIALWFFITHHPVRIVTTSVKDDHLDVLWGEIDRFVTTAAIPLDVKKGGFLACNHHEIHKVVKGKINRYSYLKGMVSKKGEGMQGHHAEYTLLIIDEASGAEEQVYVMGSTWASGPGKRMLIFGNCWDCQNFFRRGVDAGDLLAKV